jgi:hypothetical protein
MGRRERVKLADEKRASVERGGCPCLHVIVSEPSREEIL